MWDVFISYAHRDGTSAAESVKRALEATGLRGWMDDEIHAGERFRGAIREALEQAPCVVVLWSTAAITSGYVVGESVRATRHAAPLPCCLESDVQPAVPLAQHVIQGLPMYLEAKEFTARQLETLVAEVKRKPHEPRSEPSITEVVRDLRDKLEKKLKDRYSLV